MNKFLQEIAAIPAGEAGATQQPTKGLTISLTELDKLADAAAEQYPLLRVHKPAMAVETNGEWHTRVNGAGIALVPLALKQGGKGHTDEASGMITVHASGSVNLSGICTGLIWPPKAKAKADKKPRKPKAVNPPPPPAP